MKRLILLTGAILGMITVIFGAFGAHYVKNIRGAEMTDIWETATKYLAYHSLALLALGLLVSEHINQWFRLSFYAFLAGCLIFSGSLYLLVATETRALGAVTPLGGVLLITGWILLATGIYRSIK